MSNQDQGWFARMLSAFSGLFSARGKGAGQRQGHAQPSRNIRRIAGHWPVWVEFSKSTREAHELRHDSAVSLRFAASEAGLLRSLKITTREFNGVYVAEKKQALVQVPERLVEEVMRNPNEPVYVEGFVDGETLGVRRFGIPLSF
ncbi:hypothetical protein [Chitinimonas koreensis]|uniref:hypothetical protein n=1 Tax=Chitinimonas koreensis TaxID=356302 RepID=UPI0012FA5A9F|nr:hypothetical protein [Chitinimonas koreensis]QNM95565.1 hypothetical protein H9L41_17100 [Chitinimonas koreensis]